MWLETHINVDTESAAAAESDTEEDTSPSNNLITAINKSRVTVSNNTNISNLKGLTYICLNELKKFVS